MAEKTYAERLKPSGNSFKDAFASAKKAGKKNSHGRVVTIQLLLKKNVKNLYKKNLEKKNLYVKKERVKVAV